MMIRHQHQFYLTDTPPPTPSRRSHRKSRSGCLECKKLHLKCTEEKPGCRKCLSRGKICQYTTHSKPKGSGCGEPEKDQDTTLVPSKSLSAVSPSFTLHDLKLFHHFLCWAHPPLPLGNKDAWTKDIPQLSHHSMHLMSALLGLAASHMRTKSRDDGYSCTALLHRGRAMAGLREACAKRHHSATDYDAMLAICYILTFQSALLPADDSDFATFIIGVAMLTERIQDDRCPTVFKNLSPNSTTLPDQRIAFPRLDMSFYPEGSRLQVLLSKGAVSLRAAETCIGQQYQETNILIGLQEVFSALQLSPNKGYDQFVSHYAVWFKAAEDRVVFSGEATATEAQILWVFYIALQIFTTLIVVDACRHKTQQDRPTKTELAEVTPKMRGIMEWLHAVEALAPFSLRTHFVWLRLVSDEAIFQINMAPVTVGGIQAKLAALCDFSSRAHNVYGEILEMSASMANWTEYLVASGGKIPSNGAVWP